MGDRVLEGVGGLGEWWEAAEDALAERRGLEHDAMAERFAAECEQDAARRLLSTAEAATSFSVSAETVRERWRRGELRAYGSEAKLRFRRADLDACFEVRPPRHRDAVKASQPAPRLSRRPVRRFKQKAEQMRRVA